MVCIVASYAKSVAMCLMCMQSGSGEISVDSAPCKMYRIYAINAIVKLKTTLLVWF